VKGTRAVGACLVLCAGSALAAESKRSCVAASDRAQEERSKEHLTAAREHLLLCAQESCPAPVRRACEEWLKQVEASLASVVFRVRDQAGHDVTAVMVYVDGRLVAPSLDGRAIPIDPGKHLFRLEPMGASPIEESLLIVESEKARLVSEVVPPAPGGVALPPPEPAPPPVALSPPSEISGRKPPPPVTSWRVPTSAWVLGAVSVAAAGSFAYFTATGASTYNTCVQAYCADPGTKTSIDVDRAMAWTSLGVGVAALAAAGWAVWSAKPSAEVAVTPSNGGAVFVLTGRF
jgi:hypothetical protein